MSLTPDVRHPCLVRTPVGSVALAIAAVLVAACGISDSSPDQLSPVGSIPTQVAPRVTATVDGSQVWVSSQIECAGPKVAPDKNELALEGGDCAEVQVVDARTYDIVATLHPGHSVNQVSFAAAAPVALLGGTSHRRVTVIDSNTLRVAARVTTAGYPTNSVVSADGATAYIATIKNLFGSQPSPGALQIVDTATGEVLRTIPSVATGAPATAWVGPGSAGSYVAVTRQQDRSVVLALGTDGRRVVARAPLGGQASSMAFSADGGRAFVADVSGALTVIDTGTKRVVERAKTSTYPVAVTPTPDGRQLWTTSVADMPPSDAGHRVLESSVAVYDTPGLTKRGVAARGRLPAGLWFVQDGAMAYVSELGGEGAQGPATESRIRVIDANTLQLVSTLLVGQSPTRPAFSPDGSLMFIADLDPEGALRVVDTNSTEVVAAIPLASPGPAIVAGDQSVFVPLQSDHRVDIFNFA